MDNALDTGEWPQERLAGWNRAVVWLRNHNLSPRSIASLLGASEEHIRLLDYRGRRAKTGREILPPQLLEDTGIWTPPSAELRKSLGIRAEEDSVERTPRGERRLEQVEAALEACGSEFWSGVRFEAGITRIRALYPLIGFPSHARRIRLRARVHELCSETYLHFGKSLRALEEGLRAYHLYRAAFHESGDPHDLLQVGRVARILSQVFLLRCEGDMAVVYLELHRQARERLGLLPRPEYHRQLATLAFQVDSEEADQKARGELKLAMRGLEETVDYGTPKARHEVLDIGLRQMHLLRPLDWEASNALLELQLRSYPADDIHIGLNIVATAACGLSLDSPQAQQQALELLERHRDASAGYLRTETSFRLLRLTPQLPAKLRPSWSRFALYENTFPQRDQILRYKIRRG